MQQLEQKLTDNLLEILGIGYFDLGTKNGEVISIDKTETYILVRFFFQKDDQCNGIVKGERLFSQMYPASSNEERRANTQLLQKCSDDKDLNKPYYCEDCTKEYLMKHPHVLHRLSQIKKGCAQLAFSVPEEHKVKFADLLPDFREFTRLEEEKFKLAKLKVENFKKIIEEYRIDLDAVDIKIVETKKNNLGEGT
jgi:hypothetical protein